MAGNMYRWHEISHAHPQPCYITNLNTMSHPLHQKRMQERWWWQPGTWHCHRTTVHHRDDHKDGKYGWQWGHGINEERDNNNNKVISFLFAFLFFINSLILFDSFLRYTILSYWGSKWQCRHEAKQNDNETTEWWDNQRWGGNNDDEAQEMSFDVSWAVEFSFYSCSIIVLLTIFFRY